MLTKKPAIPVKLQQKILIGGLLTLVLGWRILTSWIRQSDPTAGLIDPGTWQLLLLAVISFVVLAALSLYLLHLVWMLVGLPELSVMVLHFKQLTLWQQFMLYWASYALLLLGSLISLLAIF